MGEEEDQIGAVTGLAWTEVGGELLTIEAVTVPGKGQIKTTGKLGDVMQESIQAAFSFVKARAPELRRQAEPVRPQGHPRPSARRRGAEGRPVGRRRHGDRDHLDPDRHPGPPRRRDDRRGDPARPGAADRRPQGEIARGAARRHHQGADPGREREGSGRDPGDDHRTGSRSSPSAHVDEVLSHALATPVAPIDWTEADELGARCRRPELGGGRPDDRDPRSLDPATEKCLAARKMPGAASLLRRINEFGSGWRDFPRKVALSF